MIVPRHQAPLPVRHAINTHSSKGGRGLRKSLARSPMYFMPAIIPLATTSSYAALQRGFFSASTYTAHRHRHRARSQAHIPLPVRRAVRAQGAYSVLTADSLQGGVAGHAASLAGYARSLAHHIRVRLEPLHHRCHGRRLRRLGGSALGLPGHTRSTAQWLQARRYTVGRRCLNYSVFVLATQWLHGDTRGGRRCLNYSVFVWRDTEAGWECCLSEIRPIRREGGGELSK